MLRRIRNDCRLSRLYFILGSTSPICSAVIQMKGLLGQLVGNANEIIIRESSLVALSTFSSFTANISVISEHTIVGRTLRRLRASILHDAKNENYNEQIAGSLKVIIPLGSLQGIKSVIKQSKSILQQEVPHYTYYYY